MVAKVKFKELSKEDRRKMTDREYWKYLENQHEERLLHIAFPHIFHDETLDLLETKEPVIEIKEEQQKVNELFPL